MSTGVVGVNKIAPVFGQIPEATVVPSGMQDITQNGIHSFPTFPAASAGGQCLVDRVPQIVHRNRLPSHGFGILC